MRRKNLLASAILIISTVIMSAPASAQDVLTGDTRLACEAILCLATGASPSECKPSLQRYFSISFRKIKDTIRGRVNFLNMCPVSNQTPEMQSLVSAVANGAGRCDPTSLNHALLTGGGWEENRPTIHDQLPSYCSAYTGHDYTDFAGTIPRYVGIPKRGGYWVEAKNYDRELEKYNARIAQEDAENNNGWRG